MLPIFRIVTVGGVLFAILLVTLAVSPPGGTRPVLTPDIMPARGALQAREDHPEWRRLLITAALRRADELEQLRALPDTPVRSEPPAVEQDEPAPETPSVAALPAEQSEAAPEHEAVTLPAMGDAEIPEDALEEASFALPEALPAPRPDIAKPAKPKQRAKPSRDTRKSARRARRGRTAARSRAPAQVDFFQALFGGQAGIWPGAAPP